MSAMEHSTASQTEPTDTTKTVKTTQVKAYGDHHFPQTTVPGLVGTGPILPEWLRKPFRRIRTKHS
jgi:hypothetical protein